MYIYMSSLLLFLEQGGTGQRGRQHGTNRLQFEGVRGGTFRSRLVVRFDRAEQQLTLADQVLDRGLGAVREAGQDRTVGDLSVDFRQQGLHVGNPSAGVTRAERVEEVQQLGQEGTALRIHTRAGGGGRGRGGGAGGGNTRGLLQSGGCRAGRLHTTALLDHGGRAAARDWGGGRSLHGGRGGGRVGLALRSGARALRVSHSAAAHALRVGNGGGSCLGAGRGRGSVQNRVDVLFQVITLGLHILRWRVGGRWLGRSARRSGRHCAARLHGTSHGSRDWGAVAGVVGRR